MISLLVFFPCSPLTKNAKKNSTQQLQNHLQGPLQNGVSGHFSCKWNAWKVHSTSYPLVTTFK